VCYDDGDTKEGSDTCLYCNPVIYKEDWTVRITYTPCPDDLNECTDDYCLAGNCEHPDKDITAVCNDEKICSHTDRCDGNGSCKGVDYTCTPNQCEISSTCDGNGGCTKKYKLNTEPCNDGNNCTHTDLCSGNGECHGTGYTCPAPNECQVSITCKGDGTCDTVDKEDLTQCSHEQPDVECTNDVCIGGECKHNLQAGHCLINGSCYHANDVKPGFNCMICDPAVKTDGWSLIGGHCLISNICYADQDVNPSVPCQWCDSMKSASVWSVVTDTCRIGITCYNDGDVKSGTEGCMFCDSDVNQTAWTKKSEGSDCSSQTKCATCDSAGACVYNSAYNSTQNYNCPLCQKCTGKNQCGLQASTEDLKEECADDNPCMTGKCDAAGACGNLPDTTDCGLCAKCNSLGACSVYDSTQNSECGFCKKCKSINQCENQAASEDLNENCDDTNPCLTGKCNNSGACGTKSADTDCGLCAKCDGSGNCNYDSNQNNECGKCQKCVSKNTCGNQSASEDVKEECPSADCRTGSCNNAGDCGIIADNTACTKDGNGCTKDLCSGGVCSHSTTIGDCWYDSSTTVTWTVMPANNGGAGYAQPDAITYCSGLTKEGVTGWRLPYINELRSVIRAGVTPPCNYGVYPGGACAITDTCYETACNNGCGTCTVGLGPASNGDYIVENLATADSSIWSDKCPAGYTPYCVYVDYNYGVVSYRHKTNDKLQVRCVKKE
jgi:hypothetical protein